ncbi:hypothetical protein [Microvirga yunnanensis]|uniref:hypothetical protein n=1 Tax=Microvirga yunnanensis TaxID=2953740 RepID=UPI0021C7A775|nr:hypothetical protein [Microvirga sp. HBU65207]
MQPLVARTRLKAISNPNAGPVLIGKMEDALVICLAKPWRRAELESECIIGGVT